MAQKKTETAKTTAKKTAKKSPAVATAAETTTITLPGGVELAMVRIPGKDYWMGKFPVTQAQYEAVTGDNPSEFKGTENPVETVSWNDCQKFLKALNALPAAKASGFRFRLPPQKEWEFACRADGEEIEYRKLENASFDTFVADNGWCRLADGTAITKETVGEVAWVEDNSGGETHPVGQKKPNAFGLYDMFGNVAEWTDSAAGDNRSIRGGSFRHPEDVCVGCYQASPEKTGAFAGFRLFSWAKSLSASVNSVVNGGKPLETVTVELPQGVALEMKELPSGIFMGVVPVTKQQWWALLGDFRPEKNEENTPFNCCPRDFPPFDEDDAHSACMEVEESGKDLDLGWDRFREIAFDRPAARFIEALNASDAAKKAGLAFRLPTDAEWEYACRAGSKGEYGLREDGVEIDDKNLSSVCTPKNVCEVGTRMANAFGLFDMVGNVLEWTSTDTKNWNGDVVAKARGGNPGNWNWKTEKLPHENNFNDACSGTWDQGFRLCADRKAD